MSLALAGRGYVLETGRVALDGPSAALAADPRVRAARTWAAPMVGASERPVRLGSKQEGVRMADEYESYTDKEAAERQLRVAMAKEAREERELREKIQKYFYIAVGAVVVIFIALMLFT